MIARDAAAKPDRLDLPRAPALRTVDYVARLYLVLDYREHGGRLPLGAAVIVWRGTWTIFPFLLVFPAIALFPDGRLSPRWRKFMRGSTSSQQVVFVVMQLTGQIV